MMTEPHEGVHAEQEHFVRLLVNVVKNLCIVGGILNGECTGIARTGVADCLAGRRINKDIRNGNDADGARDQFFG